MIDPGKAVQQSTEKPDPSVAAASELLFGAVFGVAFGFLLQKGGVGKFNVLIGQLLLQDFTVAKVMLTAIVVGVATLALGLALVVRINEAYGTIEEDEIFERDREA